MPVRDLEPVHTPDGRVLTCCEVGDPDGSVAFYLHGTGSSRLEVALFDAAASNAGVRLVAWDRPGSGGSTKQPGRTVHDVVGDARLVAERVAAEQVPVIGVSGGGSHVLALAATAPDLVPRAVAINPGPPSDAEVLRDLSPAIARLIAAARDRPRLFAVLVPLVQLRGLGKVGAALRERSLHPLDRELVTRPDIRPLAEAAAEEGSRQPRAFTDEALMLWGRPWGIDLTSFPVPLDVFTGADDSFRPFCDRLERAGATLHVFPGGHLSGFAPEVLADVLQVAVR